MSIFHRLSLTRRVSCVLFSAAAVFQSVSVWTALCGISAVSQVVLAVVLGLAVILSDRLQRFPVPRYRGFPRRTGESGSMVQPGAASAVGTEFPLPRVLAAAGLGLAAAAALPWGLNGLLELASSLISTGGSGASLLIYGIPGAVVCGVLTILLSVSGLLSGSVRGLSFRAWLPIVMALPVVSLPLLVGISQLMLMAAAVGAAIVCVSLGAVPGLPPAATEDRGRAAVGGCGLDQPEWRPAAVFGGLSAGLMVVALTCLWGQLLPLTVVQLVLLYSVTAGLLLGVWKISAGRAGRKLVFPAGLLMLFCFVWLQPWLPALFLGISEGTVPGLSQQLLRALAAGGISAWLLSSLLPRSDRFAAGMDKWFFAAWLCAVPLGLCSTVWISVPRLLAGVTLLGLLSACGMELVRGGFVRLRQAGLRIIVPLTLVLIAVPCLAPMFDLPVASRVLMAARTLEARRRGVGMELIPHTEPARLALAASGIAGELSIWRQSAVSFEVVRSGRVTAKASSDTRIMPQTPEEVLPAIIGLCNHPRPGRVLVLGDDSGAVLKTCTRFPVQQILAVQSDAETTAAATEFLWRHLADRPDHDSRVQLMRADLPLVVRSSSLGQFDVVIAAAGPAAELRHASLLTSEFYAAVRSRLSAGGVFCQRLTLENPEPEVLRRILATLSAEFRHAGVIQMLPGDFLLTAADSEAGLLHPQLLEHLQRSHVQREAAACGWDWAQIAVLPLATAHGDSGMFATATAPQPLSAADGGTLLPLSVAHGDSAAQAEKLRLAFAPFQQQIAAAVPPGEAHEEAKRRLSALQQQVEILAGMPDQPWTYRRSLRMEMQRSPRPPVESVKDGKIVRSTHPLDEIRQDYFLLLGQALQTAQNDPEASLETLRRLDRLVEGGEPLLGWFSHHEIVRLHELLQHPDPADELRHRLHLVFYAVPADASVRPAISALRMLVEQPQLVPDPAERYDLLNAVLQKLIERWEARTAWEPRSAVRVQQDVDLSVQAGRQAMEQMQQLAAAAGIPANDFRQRRNFVQAALISPLRTYCEQVLAHRMKTESPAVAGSDDPDDLPLLAPATGISTN